MKTRKPWQRFLAVVLAIGLLVPAFPLQGNAEDTPPAASETQPVAEASPSGGDTQPTRGPGTRSVTIGPEDHPAHAAMDGSTQTSNVYLGPVRVPNAKDVFVGDKVLQGYALPDATVIIKVNGAEFTTTSGSSGYFTYLLDTPLAESDVITYQAKIGDRLSAEATHVVGTRLEAKGPLWDTIVVGTTVTNNGLITDTTGRYYRAQMFTHALTEPWFQYIGAKMYYQLPAEVAPYVTKVVLDNKHVLAKNTDVLPGALVWESGVLMSQQGWIFPTGATDKNGELRIYLDDTTPMNVFTDGILLNTWAQKNEYILQDFVRNTVLFDLNQNEYGPSTRFRGGVGDKVPVVDKAYYSLERNDIFVRYSLRGPINYFDTKYDLRVTLDPKLLPHIDTSSVQMGQYSQGNDYVGTTYGPFAADGQSGTTLIFDNLFDKLMSKGLANRQDFGIVFKFKPGQDITSAMASNSESFDIKIDVVDKQGRIARYTDGETKLRVQDLDRDGILGEYESRLDINASYTNKDTDADGKEDGAEIKNNTDPLVAPFNWYDQQGEPIPALAATTTEIKGYIENNTYYRQDVAPRRVELHKVNGDGSTTRLTQTTSAQDARGSFTLPVSGVSPGDKVVVKIFTDEVKGKDPAGDQTITIQRAYAEPEVSAAMLVAEKTIIDSIDNHNVFGDTFTWIGGKTEPNAEVVVTFADGNVLTFTADADGKFKKMMNNALLQAPTLKPGEKITVVATAPGKAPSDPFEITIREGTQKPTLNDAHAEETEIKGNAATDAEIVLKVSDPSDPDNPDKNYTIPPENITKNPTTGDFTANLPAGKELAKDQVIRVEATQPGKVLNATETIVGDAGFDKNNITSIVIEKAPQHVYTEGDTFNPQHMVVKLTDNQGREKTVTVNSTNGEELTKAGVKMTKDTVTPLATTDTEVVLTPINAPPDTTAKATQRITVNAKVFNPDGITAMEVATQPKLDYAVGDALDLSLLKIKLTDNQGLEKVIGYDEFNQYGITASKTNGATLAIGDNDTEISFSKDDLTATTNKLVVKEKTEAPEDVKIVKDPDDGKYYATGTAPAGSTVEIKKEDGSSFAPPLTGTAGTDGTFKIEVPNTVPEGLVNIDAVATESGKAPSDAVPALVDRTNPDTPNIRAESDGSAIITPPSDAVKTVVTFITDQDTTVTTTATFNSDTRKWELDNNELGLEVNDSGMITIPADKVNPGSEVKATVEDQAGNKSEEAKANVLDVSEAPTAAQGPNQAKTIVGTGVPGATVMLVGEDDELVLDAEGAPIQAKVDAEGNYTLNLPADTAEGAKFSVVQIEDGKIPTFSDEVTVSFTNTTPVAETPVIDPVSEDQQNIKIGNLDANANKVEIKEGDTVVATLTKDAAGNWTSSDQTNYPVAEGTGEDAGKLIVTPSDTAKAALEDKDITATASNSNATNDAGKTSEPRTYDVVAEASAKATDLAQDGKKLTGKGVAGATVTLTDEAGTAINGSDGQPVTATVDSEGNFELTIPDSVSDGTKVKVSQKEPDKTATLSDESVTLDTVAPSVPAGLADPHTGDTSVKVTLPADAAVGDKVVVTVGEGANAKTYEHTVTAADLANDPREVTINVDPALAEGDKVSAVMKDQAGNTSPAVEKTTTTAATPGDSLADQIDPNKPADKVKVDNVNGLSDAEKEKVKKAVEKANESKFPDGTTVEVADDGTATITYPDNSQDQIPGSDLVEAKTDADRIDPKKPDARVPVADINHLTDEEKANVKGQVEDANPNFPDGTTVVINDDGSATITYPDGSKDHIPGAELVEPQAPSGSQADNITPKVPDEKTEVDDPANLTDEEKADVKDKLEKENPTFPDGTTVVINDDGSATITYPDTSVDTIPGSALVTQKPPVQSDADKITPIVPDKTPVADLAKLTDAEKAEVKKKVEDANKDNFPDGTTVRIFDNGAAVITYPDGSKDTIAAKALVKKKSTSGGGLGGGIGGSDPVKPDTEAIKDLKDELQKAIDELKKAKEDGTTYTEDSKKDADDAAQDGTDLLDKKNLTEQELKDMIKRLLNARLQLIVAVTLNTVDHFAYIYGYPDSTFMPDRAMTRAEVAVMFRRLMLERPEADKTYESSYSDVRPGDWFANDVAFMEEKGLVKGYPDGTFGPNQQITRAEFAAMAIRFASIADGKEGPSFSDVADGYWAKATIAKAAAVGWLAGYKDGTFGPDRNITRAEVVAIVNRMLNRSDDTEFLQTHADQLVHFSDLSPDYWAYNDIMEATNGHDYTRGENKRSETWDALNGKRF